MRKDETYLIESICQAIMSKGGDAWHVHGSAMQRAGEPDIDGWIPVGESILHLKIEVKTPTGKPSPLQVYRLEKYQKAGYVTGIVTSVEELWKLLHHYGNTN